MNNIPNNENDYKNTQPEVLGELRKEKIGKPLLVIEMLVLFVAVLIALPIISKMLADENSQLYKMIYGNQSTVQPVTPTGSEFQDGNELQALSENTTMKYNSIVMKNFIIGEKSLTVTMFSYNGIIDLDKEDYFLEIYGSSKKLLGSLKLSGVLDNREVEYELKSSKITFNPDKTYYGKIVKMTETDYEEVNLATDESGIGSFTCSLDERSIEYVFQNGYLIRINDNAVVNIKDYSNEQYLDLKTEYENKYKELSTVSSFVENEEGFKFNANLDLQNYRVPESVDDDNYFEFETLAKKIKFTLESKGFDCK